MRVIWAQGNNLSFTGDPSALARNVYPHMTVLQRHLLPNMHFQCCMLLPGILGGNNDISAARGESIA